ncbi:MAG: divergent PAP2 family protein [Firmicutes bacterium]|nr:divergent PAP2 family protein [Bacillota bacterium]MCL5971528.1 divergent PAP2 family protein [Bacillota bacterium]
MHSGLSRLLNDSNRVLITAVLAVASAQLLKFVIYAWYKKRPRLERLIGSGGMPSSHSAMVSALSTAMGFQTGWQSPLFAVSCVLGFIVLYDAIGVRRTVGLQSKYLNRMSDSDEFPEFVGHTPVEVLMGALWGVFIGILLYRI